MNNLRHHIKNKEMGKNQATSIGPVSQQSLNVNYKSKGRPAAQKREWDDSGMTQPSIPQYRVTEDKYASGYVAGLKR